MNIKLPVLLCLIAIFCGDPPAKGSSGHHPFFQPRISVNTRDCHARLSAFICAHSQFFQLPVSYTSSTPPWNNIDAAHYTLIEHDGSDADQLLEDFANQWDESKWIQKFRRKTYMRELNDDGWRARMKLLQQLVANGKDSIPALEKHLGSEHVPTRIVVAQAIGYLARHANVEKLVSHLKDEPDAAVRLYLVDAIGMSGKGQDIDWKSVAKGERNRDVRMHINYAKERKDSPVPEDVVDTLASFDVESLPPVEKGQPAPDFTLKSLDGPEFTLSQFKGVKPVVLVFVYGDT